MKRLLYILAIVGLAACNTKKPEPTQNYVAKPEDLASLNQRIKTPVVNPTGTSGALNPAHGQPGHRCEIAVGAPLNSAPAKATAPNVQTQTVVQPTTAVPQPTATVTTTPTAQTAAVNAKGEKLNPAHGQPNHRCDIAVGAPLNSKTTQAVVSSTNPKVTVTPPAATTTAPLINEKGQRLNPAHGQPNHRCEIAVGAPLT